MQQTTVRPRGWFTPATGTARIRHAHLRLWVAAALIAASATGVRAASTQTATGYRAGETNVISCTYTRPATNQLWSLLWTPTLPGGWTLGTASGDSDADPEVSQGAIVFKGSLTNNPVVFSYEVIVPAGQSGVKTITGAVEYQLNGMVNPATESATPDPLTLSQLHRLVVNSAHDSPVPSGTNVIVNGTLTQARVSAIDLQGTTRYVSTGWALTGNASTNGLFSGAGTNVALIVTNDASLVWQWSTEFDLAVTSGAGGSVNSGSVNGWYTLGTQATNIMATSSNGYHFTGWTGDVPASNTLSNPLALLMDQPRAVAATFALDQADLGITKAVTGGSAIGGQNLIYTITVTNSGPQGAQNVQAVETLPLGVTTANALTNSIGNLAMGASTSYTFTVAIDPATVGPITNRVAVSSTTADPGPGSNTASVITVVANSADVAVSKAVTGGTLVAGQTVVYTIAVTNAGPSVANGVWVLDSLPLGTTTAQSISNSFGTLSVGAAATYVLTVNIDPNTLGPITNKVQVFSANDPTPGNDNASTVSVVTASADLGITKAVSGGSTNAGEQLVYRITVTNSGPSVARTVSVTDTPGSGMTPVDGTVTNLGALLPGATTSYTFRVMIDPTTLGTITNSATVSSPTFDPGPMANSASATVATFSQAWLEIVKSIAAGSPIAGTELTYRILVTNQGPSVARGVSVTESPGAGLIAVDGTLTNLGTLAVNASTSYLFRAMIDQAALGPVTNLAVLTTTTTNLNGGGTVATLVSPLTTEADLRVQKTAPPTASAGSNLTYTVVVTNAGPSQARTVTYLDTPSALTTPLDSTSGGLGNLAAGASTSFTFRVQVIESAEGPTTNTISVSSATTDPTPGNNSASAVVTIDAFLYTIMTSAGPGGSVVPAGAVSVAYGRSTNIVVRAMDLYHITGVLADSAPVGSFAQGSNTFVHAFLNVTNGHTLAAAFGIDTGLVATAHSGLAYAAMQTNTLTASFSKVATNALNVLQWTPTLPPGWTLGTASGAGGPVVTNGTSILFTGDLATNVLAFSYTVVVPFGQKGSNTISGSARYQLQGMVSNEWVTAQPNPLALYAYHSADFHSTFGVIDGTELNYILNYWRSGFLQLSTNGAEGYSVGSINTNGARHAADYKAPAWVIDGSEANRVLAYWRAGGYHVDSQGLDGYAAGLATFFTPSSLARAGKARRTGTLSVAADGGTVPYDPGQPVTVSFALSYTPGLVGLAWRPLVPAGWQVLAVTGDGKPEFHRGEALWVGSLPASPVHVSCTLLPPIEARGVRAIRGQAEAQFVGMSNPDLSSANTDTLTLAARDADADGIPDAWEARFAGPGGNLDPTADGDGDGCNNLAESIAGTDPTDPDSRLGVSDVRVGPGGENVVQWPSVADRVYSLDGATNLATPFATVAAGLTATPPLNVYTDATSQADQNFYRIQVETNP